MGIFSSPRGTQDKNVKRARKDLLPASREIASNTRNIMWGSPSSQTAWSNTLGSSAGGGQARQRSPSVGSATASDFTAGGYTGGAGGQAGGGQNQDYQGIVKNLIGNRPLTVETLKSIEPQLAQHGLSFRWNARGTGADIILPNGTEIDFVGGMEGLEGDRSFQWDPTGETVGGSGGGGITSPGGNAQLTGPGQGGVAGMSIDHYLNLMNRYGEFADTGGYDNKTLDAIRSRALSPSRAVYSDTNRAIDRSRSLQGDYSPNYAAVKAKTAREQSMALSDATTNVEGGIGQMVQQGRLAGLGGMSSLYGTTPGLANMFGNQALQGQALNNQLEMGMLGAGQNAQQLPGAWETTMGRIGDIGGAIFPFLSDRNIKKNIKPIKKDIIPTKLKKLPISTWEYKDDSEGLIHIGPMAQDFHELFGTGDDRTIHPVDVAGVTLGAIKELADIYAS